ERPHFIASIDTMADGGIVPAAGGLIVCNQAGDILGAIGVTGDTSDNDEDCARAAIEAVGLASRN
ncbi:MAG TPA: heme-binding protein, partial [Croceibacterium sp.]|nr:heme-binding protein [Croceibacterium sp.]